MSFLKKVSRAGHSLVKQAGHGLRFLDNSTHAVSGLIHQAHLGYRTIKRMSSRAIPGAGLAFQLVEMTPEARFVDSTRQDVQSKLQQTHKTLSTARMGVSAIDRGISHPVLKKFVAS